MNARIVVRNTFFKSSGESPCQTFFHSWESFWFLDSLVKPSIIAVVSLIQLIMRCLFRYFLLLLNNPKSINYDVFDALMTALFFAINSINSSVIQKTCDAHGTIIRTGITCKKIPCYMRNSTCRWCIVILKLC